MFIPSVLADSPRALGWMFDRSKAYKGTLFLRTLALRSVPFHGIYPLFRPKEVAPKL